MTHLYSRAIDYCPDDSVQIIPKHRRDYVPEGCDPMTLEPIKTKAETPTATPSEPPMTFAPAADEGQGPIPTGFKCDKCEFESKSESAMKAHITKKHAKE